MKNSKLIIAGGSLSALIMSTTANANLIGLSAFMEPVAGNGPPPAGGPRVIWRVYANFTNTTDRVNAWGAGSDFGAGSIVNVAGGPPTGFTNIGGGAGNLAPPDPGTTRDWDTYATIGVLYGAEAPNSSNAVAIITNTPQFIANAATSWVPDQTNGGGYFITPDDPQGSASYRVSGNDTDHRVLLMQLVLNVGQCAIGDIGVAWSPGGPGAGQTVTGLHFDCIPAAGTLQSLGLASLLSSRRRRRR